MDKIKGLPRDKGGVIKRNFKGAVKHYAIRTAAEGTSIRRFNEFEKISLAFGFGASFESLIKNINQAMEMTNDIFSDKARTSDLVLHLDAIRQGILKSSEGRNNIALYLCSLFIVECDEKGNITEDLASWSVELADRKIEDWNSAGYDISDFLALAASSVRGFKSESQALIENLGLAA